MNKKNTRPKQISTKIDSQLCTGDLDTCENFERKNVKKTKTKENTNKIQFKYNKYKTNEKQT